MTENKPHLFISHATRRGSCNERTKEIYKEVRCLLEKDWEVFVDEARLNPGDCWRPIILNGLSEAKAAIILFDKAAIDESDWVKAEALILCFRKALEIDFQLIPVFFDKVNPEGEYFNLFHPFQLNEVIFKFDDPSKNVAEISKEIISNLEVEKAKVTSSFHGWMRHFEGILSKVSLETLYEVWGELVKESSYQLIDDERKIRRAIVQLIHLLEVSETFEAIRKFRHELLLTEVLERTNKLIESKWIENKSVENFFMAVLRNRKHSVFLYHIPQDIENYRDFVECFFSRLIYECPDKIYIKKFMVAQVAGESDESILFLIEKTIWENLLGRRLSSLEEKHEKIVRNILSKTENIIVCYIPNIFAKRSILSGFCNRYPEIIFLIQVDFEETPDDFGCLDCQYLEPLLTDTKIKEYYDLKFKLDSILQ